MAVAVGICSSSEGRIPVGIHVKNWNFKGRKKRTGSQIKNPGKQTAPRSSVAANSPDSARSASAQIVVVVVVVVVIVVLVGW